MTTVQRIRVGVVVIDQDKILLMHRFFGGQEYYVVPGGGLEEGETSSETAIREVKEEMNLTITLGPVLNEFVNPKDERIHIHYLATAFTGVVRLGGEELLKNSPEDSYEPVWKPLADITKLPVVPEKLKEFLVEYTHGE